MAGQKPLALESGVLTQINDPDQIKVPDGSASAPGLLIGSSSGFWNDTTNVGVGLSVGGVQTAWFTANGPTWQATGTTALAPTFQAENASTTLNVNAYRNNSTGSSLIQGKARGTIASPLVPQTSDNVMANSGALWTGATFSVSGQMFFVVSETSTVDTTHMGTQWRVRMCPIGSGTLTEVLRADNENGLQMFGANPVVDQNRVFRPRSYTVGTLPTVTATGLAYLTDEGGGKSDAYADGVSWRRIDDGQVVVAGGPTARGLLTNFTTRVSYVNQDVVRRAFQIFANKGVVLGTDLLGLWVFAGAPGSSADAVRNWITPGTRDLTIVGSPTWSQLGGFTGDGSTARLDTGAAFSGFGGALNNASVGVYILGASASKAAVIGGGSVGVGRNLYYQSGTSGTLIARMQDVTNDTWTPSKYTGMHTITRGAAANYQLSVDDGAQTTVTRTSTAQSQTVSFLGTADTTATEFSTAQAAFAFVGVNLTAAKIAGIRAAMIDYYLVQTGVLSSTYTVANLPGANAAYEGQRLMVSDATVTASGNFGATLTGGSTNHVPTYYELGTPAWRIG